MQRTFKKYTIQSGGNPQPLIGTWLTANAGPSAEYSGRNQLVSLPVNDSSMFLKGDWLLLIATNGTNAERAVVYDAPDGTHVRVNRLDLAHVGGAAGTGEWVALAVSAHRVYFQLVAGNLGLFYIGQGPTMNKVTGAGVIDNLLNTGAGVQPNDWAVNPFGAVNSEGISEYFVDGTTGDGYVPSIGVL